MTCEQVSDILDDLLDSGLSQEARAAAEAHLRECDRCRGLQQILRQAREALASAPEGSPDLVEAVLARTTGPACGAAREGLAAGWGSAPEGLDGDLVRLHVTHCVPCRQVGLVLAQLAVDLPRMAEVDPGPAFAAQAVRRAIRVPRRSRLFDLRPFLESLLRRPRFAWEVAYVAAFVLFFLVGLPGSPLAGMPGQALAVVRANPVQAAAAAIHPVVQTARARAEAVWGAAWDVTGGRVLRARDEAPDSFWGRLGRAWTAGCSFAGNAGAMVQAYLARDDVRVDLAWQRMGLDVRSAWEAITSGSANEPGNLKKDDAERT
jgi:hypothetical protein